MCIKLATLGTVLAHVSHIIIFADFVYTYAQKKLISC